MRFVLALGLTFAAAAASCADGDRAGTGGAPADAHVSSVTGSSTEMILTVVTTGAGRPLTHPGWRPTPWKRTCKFSEMAERPAQQQVATTWVTCAKAEPGCLRASNSPGTNGTLTALASVARTTTGERFTEFAMVRGEVKRFMRMVVYGPSGQAEIVWRVSFGDCLPAPAILTSTRVWYGEQGHSGDVFETTWIEGTYATITSDPHVLSFTAPATDVHATDNLLLAGSLGGAGFTVFDRRSGEVVAFADPNGYGVMRGFLAGDSALLLEDRARSPDPAGWLWTTGQTAAVPLVQPATEAVVDLNGDGGTLVWIQAAPPPEGAYADYGPASLWTSPMATSKSGLVPAKRRAAPPIEAEGVTSVAGNGMYAFSNGKDALVHVYQLSDMRHWSFAPESYARIVTPIYVDSHEVWFNSDRGIFRQALSALGPGDTP